MDGPDFTSLKPATPDFSSLKPAAPDFSTLQPAAPSLMRAPGPHTPSIADVTSLPPQHLPTLEGLGGTAAEDLARMPGDAADILSLKAIRPHLEPEEMAGASPFWQGAERVSEQVGAVSAPVLTGAGVLGPALSGMGAVGRLAIPIAGAAGLRHLGEATGAVAGKPANQRLPGEMAAALVGDVGTGVANTLGVLSAPTGKFSEPIRAMKAAAEEAITPRAEPDLATMKRATPAPEESTTQGTAGTSTTPPPPTPTPAPEPAPEVERPLAPAATGEPFIASTPLATGKVSGRYDVVDARNLVTSFDPSFDPALQPRDRSRAASVNQVATIALNLEPQRLGESPTSDTGAPMTDEYNQVLSGNGRTAALRTLYDGGRGAPYKDWLMQNAQDFGVDLEQVAGMEQPVLVRRVNDFGDMDKTEFARQSNQQAVLGMGEAEKAASDAKMLAGNPGLMQAFAPSEDGTVIHAGNRDFLNRFIEGTGDQADLLTKDGYNTAALTKRVKNAILGAFVGPENQQLLNRLVEGADDLNVKSAVNGVMAAAPRLMAFKGTPYDLTPVMHQALKDLVTIRSSGEKVRDFLDSKGLFGDSGRTADSDRLLEHLANARGAKGVTESLIRYAGLATQGLQDAQSGGMFGTKAQTREEILQRIYGRQSEATADASGAAQTDLTLGKPPAGQGAGSQSPGPDLPGAAPGAGAVGTAGAAGGAKSLKTYAASTSGAPANLQGPAPKPAPSPSPKPSPVAAAVAKLPGVNPLLAHLQSFRRFFQNLFAPQSIDPAARIFSTILRQNNAQAALDLARADERMSEFRRAFDRTSVPRNWQYDPAKPLPHNFAVIDALERDRASLPPALQDLAKVFDGEFAWRIAEVQSLKPTAMQQLLTDYFPHIWENPQSAAVRGFMAEVASRRPFEGSKAFMKQRTVPFFADGLARGLKPVSDNPVDLLLAKMHQMDKFIMAQRTLQQASAGGMRRYLPIGQRMPEGWRIVDDPSFTVHAPPFLEVKEAFDAGLRLGLVRFMKNMGFNYERVHKIGSSGFMDVWGQYTRGGKIEARFGAPDGVIMHEIGHGLDERYGLGRLLTADAPRAAELEALAKLRNPPGKRPSPKFAKYAQTPEEQVANAVHAYLYAPDLMARVAPNVRTFLDQFIALHPELRELQDIKPSLAIASSKMRLPTAGPILAGHYIMPDGVGQVLTNHLSPGLGQWLAYRTLRAGSNILSASQLGFSAFHVGFTSLDAAFSTLGTAVSEAARLHPLEAGKLLLRTMTAPVSNYYAGKAVQNEMLRPGSGTMRSMGFNVKYDQANAGRIGQMAVQAGLRATVDPFWQTRFTRGLVRAWREGTPWGYASAPFRLPLAIVEQAMRPIVEFLVPRQKLGVFATLAESAMRQLGPGANSDQVRLALAQAADSTENRMGQITYDNLHYNRIVKDVALLMFRAYGWQLGKYRELAGVAGDVGQFARDALRGKKPDFSNRMGYAAALVGGSAILGGILHRLFTGKNPEHMVDYFHPSLGRNDPDGRPIRLSMPTYLKDLESDWRNFPDLAKMGTSVYQKLNPAVGTAVDVLRNRDFYDVRIRNEDDPALKQALDTFRFVARNAAPFSLTGAARLTKEGASPADLALPFFGFVEAKKALTMTPAETRAAEIAQDNLPRGSRTQEQADHSMLLKTLAQDLRNNPGLGQAAVRQAAQSGKLQPEDLNRIIAQVQMSHLQYQVHRMGVDDAMKVWDLANAGERQQLKQMVALKVAAAKEIDPATRQRYLGLLFKVAPK